MLNFVLYLVLYIVGVRGNWHFIFTVLKMWVSRGLGVFAVLFLGRE